MIHSVSSSASAAAVQRPQGIQDTRAEAQPLATQKSAADSADFTSAALKLLASSAEGD